MLDYLEKFNKTLQMAKSSQPTHCDYAINSVINMRFFDTNAPFLRNQDLPRKSNELLSAIMDNPIANKRLSQTHPELFDLCKKIPLFRKDYCLKHNCRDFDYAHNFFPDILRHNLVQFTHSLLYGFSDPSKDDDIKFLGAGMFCCVFKAGDYVVKLGGCKGTYNIPYSDHWAQPLLYDTLKDKNGESIMTVEVQRPLKLIKNNFIGKILADIVSKRFKASGVRWYDSKPSNIGILDKKDNNARIIPPGFGMFLELDEPPSIKTRRPRRKSVLSRLRAIDLDLAQPLKDIELPHKPLGR